MSLDEMKALFEKHSDAYFLTDDPQEPKQTTNRKDLRAFLLLDGLLPSTMDMVSCAEHDEIWLETNPEELAKVITEEQVIYLLRCGVRYDKHVDSLHSFV